MELKDVTVDLFLFVATLKERLNQAESPSLDDVYQEAKSIFMQMDQKVLPDHVLKSKYDRVRFGLCALVDEVVVTSTWEHAPEWPVLEMEFYGTKVAGNKFYDFIAELTPADKDLMEVCFFILTLGFRGEYVFDEGKWEATVINLYNQLPNLLEKDIVKLTPEAYHVIKRKAKRLDPIFSLGRSVIIFFATLIIVIIFYQVVWSSIVGEVRVKSSQAAAQIQDDELRSSLKGDEQ